MSWIRRNLVDVALVVLALVVVVPIVQPDSAQPASRLALTAAVAEHGSVDITPYYNTLGVDYSFHNGQLRSDKAPGEPLLAVPIYLAARAVGAESSSHRRVNGNLTLWLETVFMGAIPFALLLVLLRRTIARFAPQAALPVALAFGFGTILLPFAASLFGHVLAALIAFAAWSVISVDPTNRRRLLAAGALAGAAVCVEYEAFVVAVVLLAFVAVHARRDAWRFVLGAAPFALVLGAYEWAAFGAPWRLPYATYAGVYAHTTQVGLRNPVRPALDLFFSGRGLLLVSPLTVLALVVAFPVAFGKPSAARVHARVGIAVVALYVLWIASFQGSEVSEFPGPRFLIVALPFLAAPLAARWDRVRVVALVAAVWGGVVAFLALTTPLVVNPGASLFDIYRARIRAHEFVPTLWSMSAGPLAVVLYVVVVAAAATFLARAVRPPHAVEERDAPALAVS